MDYFFDLDGTLVRHNKYDLQYWIEEVAIKACNEIGLKIPKGKWIEIIDGKVSRYDFFETFSKDPIRIWKAIERFDLLMRKDLLEKGNIIPFDDLDTLDKLEGKKVLITNCGQECAEEVLEFFKIRDKFDLIIGKTPETVKQLKPNPAMILEAIRKLELNDENVLYIGDKDTDIKAARKAGVKSVLIKRNHKNDTKEKPDIEINDLHELIN